MKETKTNILSIRLERSLMDKLNEISHSTTISYTIRKLIRNASKTIEN